MKFITSSHASKIGSFSFSSQAWRVWHDLGRRKNGTLLVLSSRAMHDHEKVEGIYYSSLNRMDHRIGVKRRNVVDDSSVVQFRNKLGDRHRKCELLIVGSR